MSFYKKTKILSDARGLQSAYIFGFEGLIFNVW